VGIVYTDHILSLNQLTVSILKCDIIINSHVSVGAKRPYIQLQN